MAAQKAKAPLEFLNVARLLHERISYEVCVAHGFGQVSQILSGQRRQTEPAVREIDPFVCAEFFSLVTGLRDAEFEFAFANGLDDAANLTIIQPDTFASLN